MDNPAEFYSLIFLGLTGIIYQIYRIITHKHWIFVSLFTYQFWHILSTVTFNLTCSQSLKSFVPKCKAKYNVLMPSVSADGIHFFTAKISCNWFILYRTLKTVCNWSISYITVRIKLWFHIRSAIVNFLHTHSLNY